MRSLVKVIYSVIPFKKQMFLVVRMFFKPKEKLYRHLHFKGEIEVKIKGHKSFRTYNHGLLIENGIFWAGLENGWERQSLKVWIKLCEKATSIMDVGANTGIYSLIAATINPDCDIVAFEPVKRVSAMLEKNIRINNYKIKNVEKALSNFDGDAIVYDDLSSEHTYAVTVNKNLMVNKDKSSTVKIKTCRLDTYIEENNITHIDLIKIDVETHEAEVLEGFGKYLELFKPTILIEITYPEVAKKIQMIFQYLPYLYFNVNEDDGLKQVDQITVSDNYNFLLCSKDKALELGLIKSAGVVK